MKRIDFVRTFVIAGLVLQVIWYGMLWSRMLIRPDESRPTDFSSFYTAGRIAYSGRYSLIYDIQTQRQFQEVLLGQTIQTSQVLPFMHPPILVPVLQLISTQDYMAFYWRWVLILVCLLVATTAVINQLLRAMKWDAGSRWIFIISAFLFYPVFASLLKGQDTAFLLFGAVLWVYGVIMKKDIPAGIGLALTVIRPQIAVMLAVPFFFNRRKIWWWFCVGAAALFAYSFIQVGWTGVKDYLHILTISAGGIGYGLSEAAMFNFTGLVLRLAPGLGIGLVHALGWGLFAAALAGLCAVWRFSKSIDYRHIALAATLSLFAAPHLHYHDLAFLIIPIICLALAGVESNRIKINYASALPLAVSLALLFADLWDPLRYTVPYLLMAALPAFTWMVEKRYEAG